jgi:hypothetical protein
MWNVLHFLLETHLQRMAEIYLPTKSMGVGSKRTNTTTDCHHHRSSIRQNQMKKSKQKMISVPEKNWEELLTACVNAESEVIHLQEQVEDLDLQLADNDEVYRRLNLEYLRIKGQGTVDSVAATRIKAEFETRIAKLLRDLENTEANRKYACDHIAEQNKLIREAKTAMETYRAENIALKNQQTNAEHMARKMVQLQADLAKMDHLACPYQKTKELIHIRCGKCSLCKLEAAHGIIERATKLCEHLEKERDNAVTKGKFTSSVLEQTSKNLIEANAEKTKLQAALDSEIGLNTGRADYQKHLLEIIRLQKRTLELVIEQKIWWRKSFAKDGLELIEEYKKKHNVNA